MIKNKAIVNEENTSVEYWKKKYADLMAKFEGVAGPSAGNLSKISNDSVKSLIQGYGTDKCSKVLIK